MINILSERETMTAGANGLNLARFGDGELRLAMGGSAISQSADAKLAKELRQILAGDTKSLACIPPIYPMADENTRQKFWSKYTSPDFLQLYGSQTFGSAFVTRPDSAPNIDNPEYWDTVASLWRKRDVLYVTGGDTHLIKIIARESDSMNLLSVPKKDAYSMVDRIFNSCKNFKGTVLLACGATATVLAHRLAAVGVHAVDIGHMGMFYSVKGAYAMKPEQLATDYYRAQLKEAHRVKKWGGGGYSWAEAGLKFRLQVGGSSILDYGCGRGTFKKRMMEIDPDARVTEYDPGIEGKEASPKPADVVVCTDVMEHIEPELVDNVLEHISKICRKGALFVIAKNAANKSLPDGRNAHLVQEGLEFWKEKIDKLEFTSLEYEDTRKHVVVRAVK